MNFKLIQLCTIYVEMVIKRYATEKFLVLSIYRKTFFMAGNPKGASRLRDEQRVYWQIVCNTASAMFQHCLAQ